MKPEQERLYRYHAELCRVFSHPRRLEIIHWLREGEASVTELAKRTGMGLANLSQHLKLMRDRGVLASRKEGNVVYYRVAEPRMLQAFDLLREILLEQLERDARLAAAARRESQA